MAPRALKLGTRRSALARAQSAAVARQLEQLHPGLQVELTGIETRGDRILDKPLSTVEGKEFFTAEIDAALLAGEVDFTVHSYKDLSLQRTARLALAAVPRREQPRDIALFAPDVRQRLLEGQELRIGSSSPRRAAFVPEFLQRMLPHAVQPAGAARVRLVELRGNVDSRLRRLHEPRGAARHLDGVVLAFAGLARLWADAAGNQLLRELLAPLPRMVLPLSACPAAPAQGALALECRSDDTGTLALLRAIDDAPTRRAVDVERALLAQRGGGCHQRFGATQIDVPGLGALLYVREAGQSDAANATGTVQLHWTPELPLPAPSATVVAWDGSRAERLGIETIEAAEALVRDSLHSAEALFVTHRRALPEAGVPALPPQSHVWVPGLDTWQALAARGLWVEGCAEGLGFAALQPLLAEALLQLPPQDHWTVLTHAGAAGGWSAGRVIATYRHREVRAGAELAAEAAGAESAAESAAEAAAPKPQTTHVYWHSGAQFDRWRCALGPHVQHACGPGKTYEHLRGAGVHNLRMFPQVVHWRQWLRL
jgi:hydroxymethylbilane synthase